MAAESPTASSPLFRSPLTYAIALGVGFVACFLLNGLYRHLGNPERFPLVGKNRTYVIEDGRNPFEALVHWKSFPYYDGDFRPLYDSARGHAWEPGFRMYQPDQLKEGRAAFVYTPLAALMVRVYLNPDMTQETASNIFSIANHVLWLGAGVLLCLVLVHGRAAPWWIYALFVVQYLAYYPLAKALQLTQAGIWIYFFLALSTFLLQRSLYIPSGIALAFAISIKPHLVVIPVLLALAPRFPWRQVIACFATLFALALVCLLYAGWDNCWDYVTKALPTLSAGYAYYPNESINGLLLRLFSGQDPANFNLSTRIDWIVRASTVFALAVLVVAWWAMRRRASQPRALDNTLCLAVAIVAGTVASPVTWRHHFAVLAVALVVIANWLWHHPGMRRWRLELPLFISYFAVAWYFDSRYFYGFPGGFLSAPGFFGALGIFGCIVWLSRRQQEASA